MKKMCYLTGLEYPCIDVNLRKTPFCFETCQKIQNTAWGYKIKRSEEEKLNTSIINTMIDNEEK